MFAAQSIDVTVSASYNGAPVISKTEQMALAEAVPTPSRGTAGMWLQMPSSPRYPCQQFSVSVFANTGGEELAGWLIQLRYDNSILELLTNTADLVSAAVRNHLSCFPRLLSWRCAYLHARLVSTQQLICLWLSRSQHCSHTCAFAHLDVAQSEFLLIRYAQRRALPSAW